MDNACEIGYESSADVKQIQKRAEFAFCCRDFACIKEVVCAFFSSSLLRRMKFPKYATFLLNNVQFFLFRVTQDYTIWCENLIDVPYMVFNRIRVYDNVFDVDEASLTLEIG